MSYEAENRGCRSQRHFDDVIDFSRQHPAILHSQPSIMLPDRYYQHWLQYTACTYARTANLKILIEVSIIIHDADNTPTNEPQQEALLLHQTDGPRLIFIQQCFLLPKPDHTE